MTQPQRPSELAWIPPGTAVAVARYLSTNSPKNQNKLSVTIGSVL